MKIAILHFSDFHLKANQNYKNEMFDKLVCSLRKLGDVDRFVIAFTGDLSQSGQPQEFSSSKYVIGKIIADLKKTYNHNYVDLFMVPGNHDLDKSKVSHCFEEIDNAYDNNTYLDLYNEEIKLLDNYYNVSHAKVFADENKTIMSKTISINNSCKIQFNLINTAPFSTLKADDKELHYVPLEALSSISKKDDVSINVSLMHHTVESFNYRCKNDLHKAILNNCEFLLTGHDHSLSTEKFVYGGNREIHISRAGEMNFDNTFKASSFNIILLDAESNAFNQYSAEWDIENQMFTVQLEKDNESIIIKTDSLKPRDSFIAEIDKDILKTGKRVSDYFVFPKVYLEEKNSFGKEIAFSNLDDFVKHLDKNELTTICSDAKLGKSTLLTQLYLYYLKLGKVPLLIADKNLKKLTNKNYIKRIFEDQYGDRPIDFEKYQQLPKTDRILLLDDFDLIIDGESKDKFISESKSFFNNIVITCKNISTTFVEKLESVLVENASSQIVKIKPFYADSRCHLIRSICKTHSQLSDNDVDRIIEIIDTIVNSNDMFNLEPLFIARYTKFFIEKPSIEYVRGEETFGLVFEHSLNSLLLENSKKDDLEEIIIVLEEISAYMFRNKKDIISHSDFENIVMNYNNEYGNQLVAKHVLNSCINAEILYTNDNLKLAFTNNNYLAYFVAKFLIKIDITSIEWDYLFKFMCYGINSDIILFITYLSQNTKIIQIIARKLELLLEEQSELDFNHNTLEFIYKNNEHDIDIPSEKEYKAVKKTKGNVEEVRFTQNKLKLKETFDTDESKTDSDFYKIAISIKYLEILSKSLPRLNSILKLYEKQEIIDLLYSQTQKIVYSMLAPIQDDLELITENLMKVVNHPDNKTPKTKTQIEEVISQYGRAVMLGMCDHFSKLAVSNKTKVLLVKHTSNNINHKFMKAIIFENLGDTKEFIDFVQKQCEDTKDYRIQFIYKLIIRKHILVNPNMKSNIKQSIIDKFLGNKYRKTFLIKKQ